MATHHATLPRSGDAGVLDPPQTGSQWLAWALLACPVVGVEAPMAGVGRLAPSIKSSDHVAIF
jgi:hypothetical protein